MAVAGLDWTPGAPTVELVRTGGHPAPIAGEVLVVIAGEVLVQMLIAGEVLVQMEQPNPSGGLLATVPPLLVQQLVPNGHFDLVSFDVGLVEEGQDVEEPSVSVLLVVQLRPY